MKFLMVYPNSTGNTKVPLGVLHILNLLRREGHEIELFDMTFHGVDIGRHDIRQRGRMLNFRPLDLEAWGVVYDFGDMSRVERDLAARIDTFRPDVVGFSVTEDTSIVALDLAKVVKRMRPRPFTLFGGIFCLTEPGFVIEHAQVDAVCVGEGEDMVVDFARR